MYSIPATRGDPVLDCKIIYTPTVLYCECNFSLPTATVDSILPMILPWAVWGRSSHLAVSTFAPLCVVSLHATPCRLASGISAWRLM